MSTIDDILYHLGDQITKTTGAIESLVRRVRKLEVQESMSGTSGSLGKFLNKILLFHESGAALEFFDVDDAGLTAAIAAALVGDIVLIPAGTISGDHTVVAGIVVIGRDRYETILTGQVTLEDESVLATLSVLRAADDANDLWGVVGPNDGETAYTYNIRSYCSQQGAGDAAGLVIIDGGEVETWLCDFDGYGKGGDGYGIAIISSVAEYKTEHSYDGNASYVAGFQANNTNKPLEPLGARDCAAFPPVQCLDLTDDGGGGPFFTAWGIYDLGGLWNAIDRIQVRNYHDGDWKVGVSEDNITWYFSPVHRISWAAAACKTDEYTPPGGLGWFVNPPGWSGNARYIQFFTQGIILVGNRSAIAWWNVRGFSPGVYGTGTHYFTKFSGSTKDIQAAYATINVYACQYETYTGTPVQMWGDRGAWDITNYAPRHASDISLAALLRHLPAPGTAGNIARDDGTNWISTQLDFDDLAGDCDLADLADYARGFIIRGGAADWEAYDANNAGFLLVGDAVDIISQAFDWDVFAAGAGADMVHDHSAAGEGGQLDWDDIWSDAVHDHSAAGEGDQLDWDVVWADAVHDHSAAGEGDPFDAANLDSNGAVDGEVLTADGIGGAAWEVTVLDNHEHTMLGDGGTIFWLIHEHAFNEDHTAACDGAKVNFITANEFFPETTQIYLNGTLQRITLDYSEDVGLDAITFVAPPLVTDELLIAYQIA